MPVGPALLALEADAAVYVASVRRAGTGRYRGRLDPLEVPASGTRRERATAYLASEVRIFERVVALAPEQWWAMFFPIWPDLEVDGSNDRPVLRDSNDRPVLRDSNDRPAPAGEERPR
jgi:lauroyl/myristoyl acyltransferase